MCNKALANFINNDVIPAVKKSIEELYFYYKNNEDKIKQDILTQIEDTFKQIVINQSQHLLPDIAFINITLSRININDRKYHYPVYLYGSQWYAEPLNKITDINFNCVYSYFDTILQKLLAERKKYVNKISITEAEQSIYPFLFFYHNIVVQILRSLSTILLESEYFHKIKKNNLFTLSVNEVYETNDKIFVHRKEYLTTNQIYQLVEDKLINFEDLQNSNINNFLCNDSQCVYTNFQNSKIEQLKCRNTYFLGSNLTKCEILNTVFQYCYFSEASFAGAVVINTCFEKCAFHNIEIRKDDIILYHYKSTVFSETVIKNCHFIKCILKDLDFTKTTFENVVFDLCDMQNCKFTDNQLSNIKFEECKF